MIGKKTRNFFKKVNEKNFPFFTCFTLRAIATKVH